MYLYSVPHASRQTQIATVDHRTIAINSAIRSSLILYLYIQLELIRLEDGPFLTIHLRDDRTVGCYAFAFRGHTSDGRRLAIAVDDEAYASEHDLPSYLQELQRRLPAEVADEIVLLTERGLDRLRGGVTDH
jgi:hypothetical protein